MTKLFISYRRLDSEHVTGRIYDKLVSTYGNDNVFKDVDSIPLGRDFRHIIDEALSECDALIAVIGVSWLDALDDAGHRRLDDAEDYVRIELEFALQQATPVFPVLVGGAAMPLRNSLPKSLQPVTYLNATVVRADPDFHRDMDRLIRAIGQNDGEQLAISNDSPLVSSVTLLDASLDPNDSPYEQTVENGRKTIRPKSTKNSDSVP